MFQCSVKMFGTQTRWHEAACKANVLVEHRLYQAAESLADGGECYDRSVFDSVCRIRRQNGQFQHLKEELVRKDFSEVLVCEACLGHKGRVC